MISVVLPAYNESDTLPNTVKDIYEYLSKRDEDFQIVVVENGSTDNTLEVAKKLSKKYKQVDTFHQDLANCGNAMRKGFQESRGDIVVNFDVDFFDLDFLERAVTIIRETKHNRPSVVVGSKRAVGSRDERPPIRRLATFTFCTILRVGFGMGVTDTHGVKAFHRASVAPLEAQCHFGVDIFDTELVLRCERAGLTVHEIPVAVKESRPARSPLFTRVPRTLMGLARMRLLFLKESFVRKTDHVHAKMHM